MLLQVSPYIATTPATIPYRSALVLAVGVFAILLGATTALAQDAPLPKLPPKCEQAATERISAMGLADSVQRGVSSEVRSGVIITSGYRARFYNPTCNGYVVMNFDGLCNMEQVYTTGGCRVSGMGHW
ncbi:hypothetical protein [Azospirillum sp. sgz302134]